MSWDFSNQVSNSSTDSIGLTGFVFAAIVISGGWEGKGLGGGYFWESGSPEESQESGGVMDEG